MPAVEGKNEQLLWLAGHKIRAGDMYYTYLSMWKFSVKFVSRRSIRKQADLRVRKQYEERTYFFNYSHPATLEHIVTLYPPPLSSYWLSSHRTFPHPAMLSSFFVNRLSFLLGILTREDGTDTLSRNVGK